MEEVAHNVAKSAFFWQALCKPDQAISFKISTKSLSKEILSLLKGYFSQYDFELAYKKIATKIDPTLQKKSNSHLIFPEVILLENKFVQNTNKKQVYKRYTGWIWSW